jgi:hypothetical protein
MGPVQPRGFSWSHRDNRVGQATRFAAGPALQPAVGSALYATWVAESAA